MLDRNAPALSAPLPRVRGAAFDWAAGKLFEWPLPPRARGGPDFSAFNNSTNVTPTVATPPPQ